MEIVFLSSQILTFLFVSFSASKNRTKLIGKENLSIFAFDILQKVDVPVLFL